MNMDSRSSSSSLGTPPPPSPSPPAVQPNYPRCNDALHCSNGMPCGPSFPCPGVRSDGLNSTFNNVLHPAGPGLPGFNATVCSQCVLHDDVNPQFQKANRVRSWADARYASGNLIQLCHSCIRDEMGLYWQRVSLNTSLSALPATTGPSLQRVAKWPTLDAPDQNLCVCMADVVTPFRNYCHQCRDQVFHDRFELPWTRNEDILRTKTKAVITGRAHLVAGGPQHNVPNRVIQNRMNSDSQIGRMCPCGERPKGPEFPQGEYIAFCLACSGVRVLAQFIPEQYQQDRMLNTGLRRSPRNHDASQDRTKGPTRALRSHLHRVNIERGWLQYDPLIGNV